MIVFFDIDGTIISERSYIIPSSAVRAIRAARKNGHLMYINTGRTIMNVEQALRDIGFDGYVCGCGTYIMSGGKVLFYTTLPRETCHTVAELLYECDMCPVYERADCFFSDRRCRELGGLKALKVQLRAEGKDFSRDISESDFGFDKLVAWYDERSNLDKFRAGIDGTFDYIDRGKGFCELAVKGYSKATGIKAVCDYHGIPVKETIAIGDSLNDLPMLQAAAHPVAMGGSVKGVLDAAEFVTKKPLDDGIEYALKHYGLI